MATLGSVLANLLRSEQRVLARTKDGLHEDANGGGDDGTKDGQEEGAAVVEPRAVCAPCGGDHLGFRASQRQPEVASGINAQGVFLATAKIAADASRGVVAWSTQSNL